MNKNNYFFIFLSFKNFTFVKKGKKLNFFLNILINSHCIPYYLFFIRLFSFYFIACIFLIGVRYNLEISFSFFQELLIDPSLSQNNDYKSKTA